MDEESRSAVLPAGEREALAKVRFAGDTFTSSVFELANQSEAQRVNDLPGKYAAHPAPKRRQENSPKATPSVHVYE
jgi:hypothetical protein